MGPQDHTHLPMIVVLLIIRKHLREKNRYSLLLLGSRTEQEKNDIFGEVRNGL